MQNGKLADDKHAVNLVCVALYSRNWNFLALIQHQDKIIIELVDSISRDGLD